MYQILAEGVIDLAESEHPNFGGNTTAHIELKNIIGRDGFTVITVYSLDSYGDWCANKDGSADIDSAEADFHDYLDHLKETDGATLDDFKEFFSSKGWGVGLL